MTIRIRPGRSRHCWREVSFLQFCRQFLQRKPARLVTVAGTTFPEKRAARPPAGDRRHHQTHVAEVARADCGKPPPIAMLLEELTQSRASLARTRYQIAELGSDRLALTKIVAATDDSYPPKEDWGDAAGGLPDAQPQTSD